MIAALVAATLLAAPVEPPAEPPASPDSGTVRFSNLRFATGGNWTVAQQSPEMILRPTNATIGTHARIVITPATPFTGSLEAARDAAWAAARGGRATREEVFTSDESEIPGGGIERAIAAAVAPVGGVYVVVVKQGDFATRLTMTADTDLAWPIAMIFIAPLLRSLEIAVDEPPPSAVAGAAGGGGPAITRQFDWDGPDRADFGIYDHNCLQYGREFGALVANGDASIGSVTPQAVDWTQTLATVRGRLTDPAAKKAYDEIKAIPEAKQTNLYSAGAAASLMMGDPGAALAQLLAGVEKSPDDPDLLFNFAALLGEQGLANESLAVIQKLRALDKKPKLAAGVDAEAAIAYLTGYARMLRGELSDAKAQLANAIGRDPFLNEASHALALIQAHEGNAQQGEKTYLGGLWRFKPKELVFCGARSEKNVRAPVDDMFDTSMGVPGELVKFRYPTRADDLEKWLKEIGDLMQERSAIMKEAGERMKMLAPKLNRTMTGRPEDAYNEKMTLLLESLDESEPYVVELMTAEETIRESAMKGVESAAASHMKRVMNLIQSGTRNICLPMRASATQGINQASPQLRQIELAMRRTARDWYRIATGLNSKIGDKDWHEFNEMSLRVQLETINNLMLMQVTTGYGAYGTDTQCMEEPPDQFMIGQAVPQGNPCDEIFGNMKFKHSFEIPGVTGGPKFGFEVGCQKIKADIDYDLLKGKAAGFGTGLGGFAQLEIGRKGDYTIFAGAKGEVSGPLTKGSVKSGFYIKGNENGEIEQLGGRVQLSGKFGPQGLQAEAKDTMDFNLLPDVPAAKRGPTLRNYRGP